MDRYAEIAERVVKTASKKVASKGKREAQWLIESTGDFRGALYALAEVAGIFWRDMPFARKISKIIMGTGNTVGRIEQAEQSLAASVRTAARVEYDTQFRGRSAYVVITGLKNVSRDSDEVVETIFKLTKAFRRSRRELDSVGLNTRRMNTKFTAYTVILEIPFKGIINEAEPVLKAVLKKVR